MADVSSTGRAQPPSQNPKAGSPPAPTAKHPPTAPAPADQVAVAADSTAQAQQSQKAHAAALNEIVPMARDADILAKLEKGLAALDLADQGSPEIAQEAAAEFNRLAGFGGKVDNATVAKDGHVAGIPGNMLGKAAKMFDGNADGKLEKAEFGELYKYFVPGAGPDRMVDRTPVAANDSSAVAVKEAKTAAATLAERAPQEAARLAALPADRGAQYTHLASLMADNARARTGLQDLLLQGKLDDAKAPGGDLLDALDKLSRQAVVAPLEAAHLTANVVLEVADPGRIKQEAFSTCAAAATQTYMAMTEPAAFVNLVGSLAGPAGQATLPGGATLTRVPGTEAAQIRDRGDGTEATVDGRSDSSRLVQSAIMEYANGAETYDVKGDRGSDGAYGVDLAALGPILAQAGTKAMPFQFARPAAGDTTEQAAAKVAKRAEMFGLAAAMVQAGHPLPMVIDLNTPPAAPRPHAIVVTAVGKDHVQYTNPNGQIEHMSLAKFRDRVMQVSFVEKARGRL